MSTTDAQAFVVAPPFLVLVAVAACRIPARRATGVDPVAALWEDRGDRVTEGREPSVAPTAVLGDRPRP